MPVRARGRDCYALVQIMNLLRLWNWTGKRVLREMEV